MTTDQQSAAGQHEELLARYDGVVIWRGMQAPRVELRKLRQHEPVTVVADEGGGWLRVRLEPRTPRAEALEGYVQRSALQPRFAAQANVYATPWSDVAGDEAPATPVPYAAGVFPWAGRVAIGLVIFGWLSLVGGQLVGIGAAANYSCSDSFFSSCDESSTRLWLYLTFAGPTLVSALFAWGIAYCIWFLREIEGRLPRQ
jgi:hypothetical protein